MTTRGHFGLLMGAGGAPPPAGVTWNPADKASDITLSGGDLIATSNVGSVFRTVRATLSRSSGKRYFEVAIGSFGAGDTMIGVAASTLSLTNYTGSDSASWGYYQVNGNKYHNLTGTAFGASYPSPEVIGVAVDLTAGKIWFAKANTWQASGDPAAGTNEAYSGLTGSLFPAVSLYDNARPATGRFTAADFSYSPPSGFTGWGD